MDAILEQFGATAEQQGFNSPKISGVKSTYKKRGKQTDIGKVQKEESNLVPIEIDQDNTEKSIYNRY
jgi:hypothetical protein